MPGPARLDESATHLLHRAAQCVGEIFHAEVGEIDITPRQLAILQAIAASDKPSQTGLVEITGIDRSTLSDIMRRLIEKQLVQKRRSKHDTRVYEVALTNVGLKVLRQSTPIGERVDAKLLNALPEDRRERFLSDLRAIADLMTKDGT